MTAVGTGPVSLEELVAVARDGAGVELTQEALVDGWLKTGDLGLIDASGHLKLLGRAFFRRFRYQLCLTGYDHGSNFIGAIDGRSVLLAEEDGWEVFYSGRFQPWKHYIPLERFCGDIAEKLAWARENPGECKAMAAAARAEAALLRRPAARRAIMARILDGLAAAG